MFSINKHYIFLWIIDQFEKPQNYFIKKIYNTKIGIL